MLAFNRVLFFLIFTFFSLDLCAKQPVPNIILTDIQGNERNLYQSLEQGKVVIVEVFATWCTTCWETNKNNRLQKIYNTYGPAGTQQLEIFYIEGDTDTELNEIYGEGSFGDWTKDITYPLFSPTYLDDKFYEVFAPNGVPTSSVICPQNKNIIADIYQNDLSEIISTIQDCNTISNVTDIQFIRPLDGDLAICKPTDLQVKVLNSGTEPVSSIALKATFDDGSIFNEHICVVDLQSGFSLPIDLGEFEIPDNVDLEIINLSIQTLDDVSYNNFEVLNFKHAHPVSNNLHLSIKADRWVEADNTRWWIENSAGDIVVPVTFLLNEEEVNLEISVENNDCFTFIIADDYGDGFVLGEIELTTEDGVVIYDEINFQYRGQANFEFVGSSTATSVLDNSNSYGLFLETNLVDSEVEAQIKLPNPENVSLHVIDLSGRILISKDVIANDKQLTSSIQVQNLEKGIYFLQLATKQGVLSEKFIKQ